MKMNIQDPLKQNKPKPEHIFIRAPKELKDAIEQEALRLDTSVNSLAIHIFLEYLKRR